MCNHNLSFDLIFKRCIEIHSKCRLETKHEDLRGFRNRGEADSPRFLNHEDPRAWSLTDLEDCSFTNFIWKCCKSPKDLSKSSNSRYIIHSTCVTYFTDSDTTKKCWYWPDTDTDIRIGAALIDAKSY